MAPPDPKTGMTSDTHVRLTNLTRSFHEGEQLHAVLQSLDATFVRGEKVALRGRSGSGKSTLLNLISGIDVPDDGEVEIDGQLITAMSERDRTLFRRKHIGFVYQAFNLVPTLTVADNVRLVLELNAVKGDTATERITTLLDQVGRSKMGSDLSNTLNLKASCHRLIRMNALIRPFWCQKKARRDKQSGSGLRGKVETPL